MRRDIFPAGIVTFPPGIAAIPTGIIQMPEGNVRFPIGGSICQPEQPPFWRELPLFKTEMGVFLKDAIWMPEAKMG
jgi:hypothetical protein